MKRTWWSRINIPVMSNELSAYLTGVVIKCQRNEVASRKSVLSLVVVQKDESYVVVGRRMW